MKKKSKRKPKPKVEEGRVQVRVEVPVQVIMEAARKWAVESGFNGAVEISTPEVERFPMRGHGYVVQVREIQGKVRMATARFTATGQPSLWTMDGRVIG